MSGFFAHLAARTRPQQDAVLPLVPTRFEQPAAAPQTLELVEVQPPSAMPPPLPDWGPPPRQTAITPPAPPAGPPQPPARSTQAMPAASVPVRRDPPAPLPPIVTVQGSEPPAEPPPASPPRPPMTAPPSPTRALAPAPPQANPPQPDPMPRRADHAIPTPRQRDTLPPRPPGPAPLDLRSLANTVAPSAVVAAVPVRASVAAPRGPAQPSVRTRAEPRAAARAAPAPEPTVHVSIGRIEVRAAPAPSAPARRGEAAAPVMSLGDYLRSRRPMDGRG